MKKKYEHWPLSQSIINVMPGCAFAWSFWLLYEHQIESRATDEVTGRMIIYWPQL